MVTRQQRPSKPAPSWGAERAGDRYCSANRSRLAKKERPYQTSPAIPASRQKKAGDECLRQRITKFELATIATPEKQSERRQASERCGGRLRNRDGKSN